MFTKIQQQELESMKQRRAMLAEHEEIKPYLQMVNEYLMKTQNREMGDYERGCIAQCLQNAREDAMVRQANKLFEATTEDHISFLGIQLPVIAALLPSLVLNDIAVVQPLDRRIGAVFFLSLRAGSAKGDVAAEEVLISAKTGVNTKRGARRFAMAASEREPLAHPGDGNFVGTTAINPGLILLADALLEKVTAGGVYTTIATCNSSGAFQDVTGDSITVSGNIYASGSFNITISGMNSGDQALLTYYYRYDLPYSGTEKTGVPEEEVIVEQETVTAIDFPVKTKYSVGASIDLQKAHGLNLEDEMVKFCGGTAKFAIDQKGLDMMIDAGGNANAATAVSDWNAAIHSGQAWLWHKYEFIDRLIQGSNNIFKKTQRGVANYAICGNNVARVIRQLTQAGDFKPAFNFEKQIPTGPINIGNVTSVNNMIVIQNPYMGENDYVLGYKGDSFLYAGFIYCPYIPLFATPTLITSDLYAQKGFLSSAGFKVVNYGLFCKGTISNIGTTA